MLYMQTQQGTRKVVNWRCLFFFLSPRSLLCSVVSQHYSDQTVRVMNVHLSATSFCVKTTTWPNDMQNSRMPHRRAFSLHRLACWECTYCSFLCSERDFPSPQSVCPSTSTCPWEKPPKVFTVPLQWREQTKSSASAKKITKNLQPRRRLFDAALLPMTTLMFSRYNNYQIKHLSFRTKGHLARLFLEARLSEMMKSSKAARSYFAIFFFLVTFSVLQRHRAKWFVTMRSHLETWSGCQGWKVILRGTQICSQKLLLTMTNENPPARATRKKVWWSPKCLGTLFGDRDCLFKSFVAINECVSVILPPAHAGHGNIPFDSNVERIFPETPFSAEKSFCSVADATRLQTLS